MQTKSRWPASPVLCLEQQQKCLLKHETYQFWLFFSHIFSQENGTVWEILVIKQINK